MGICSDVSPKGYVCDTLSTGYGRCMYVTSGASHSVQTGDIVCAEVLVIGSDK